MSRRVKVLLVVLLFVIAAAIFLSIMGSNFMKSSAGHSETYNLLAGSIERDGYSSSANEYNGVKHKAELSRQEVEKFSSGGKLEENMSPESQIKPVNPRLIIKTGSLSMVVKDVSQTLKTVGDYAEQQGGFVVSSKMSKSDTVPSGSIVIRIPAGKFDSGIASIKQMGDVKVEEINGEDVTEEFVDLNARLKNLRATEKQLFGIMKKAQKISDVLSVQNELTTVRGEIEELQGKIKYLRQSSDLSVISVYLAIEPGVLPVVEKKIEWKPVAVIKEALHALKEVGKSAVEFLIWIVVFIPVWGGALLVLWIIYKVLRRWLPLK